MTIWDALSALGVAFDLWTIQHFLAGSTTSLITRMILGDGWKKTIIFVVLLIAFGWEFAEFLMETGFLGQGASNWAMQEPWINRCIDPLLVTYGGWLEYRYKNRWFSALSLAVSALWPQLNAQAPDCMYVSNAIWNGTFGWDMIARLLGL